MPEPIQPALTPEEWRDVDRYGGGDFMTAEAGPITFHAHEGRRHAIAAVALRGQPYGFTHDGLDALDMVARFADRHAHPDVGPHVALLARREIEKIRALLPPEPPNA